MLRRGTLARIVSSVWIWMSVDSRPAGEAPKPSARLESLFSLTAMVFTAVALAAIVTRAGGHDALTFAFALAAGAFGASASVLCAFRTRNAPRDTPPVVAPWPTLLVKTLLGAASASLFYWLAKLGILAGGVFPDLDPYAGVGTDVYTAVQGMAVIDFMKLMMGCFLAGFAERLARFSPRRSADRS